jgi:hypothetical protein
MNRLAKLFLVAGLVGALLCVAGVAGGARSAESPQFSPSPASRARVIEHRTSCSAWAVPSAVELDPRPLVWVVDGAGDLKGCSHALAQANAQAGNTIELSTFAWSHGHRRLLIDQIDWSHARARGEQLAAAILERQTREPNRRVVLVAHSAGCAVALAAGDTLPPDSIDRTILLAPSVSTGYDLRPSLWATKEGVDVFCSRKDWVALGFVTRVVGTTDRWTGTAAGRIGFQPRGSTALDPAQAARLRQHFWSAEQAWTGHTGGHHGTLAPTFILAYLLPLIDAPVK